MADEPLRAYELEGDAEPECLERIHELLDRLWMAEPAVAAEDRIMFATAAAQLSYTREGSVNRWRVVRRRSS